jgi:hypothetical protein
MSFQPHHGTRVDSASNKNEYDESSWGKKRPARRADNLTAICEPNVCKLWEPQPLITLRASAACTGTALSLPYITAGARRLHHFVHLLRQMIPVYSANHKMQVSLSVIAYAHINSHCAI